MLQVASTGLDKQAYLFCKRLRITFPVLLSWKMRCLGH